MLNYERESVNPEDTTHVLAGKKDLNKNNLNVRKSRWKKRSAGPAHKQTYTHTDKQAYLH